MAWRDATPDDLLASVRRRGLEEYPTDDQRDDWEQENGLEYYQGKPLSELDRNWRSKEERDALNQRTWEEKLVRKKLPNKLAGTQRHQRTSLMPLPLKEKIEATFAPSVNMLALQIHGADPKEHLAIFEWITERLKSLISI